MQIMMYIYEFMFITFNYENPSAQLRSYVCNLQISLSLLEKIIWWQ